jgi:hypothetical protein
MRVAILTANAYAGDAIGNQVAEKVAFFLDRGAEVRVFSDSHHRLHPRVRLCCRPYFYFFATYASPGPNALSPTFESKFARMEYLGNDRFTLYFMLHTREWVGLYDALSVDECMKAIQDDAWFVP